MALLKLTSCYQLPDIPVEPVRPPSNFNFLDFVDDARKLKHVFSHLLCALYADILVLLVPWV